MPPAFVRLFLAVKIYQVRLCKGFPFVEHVDHYIGERFVVMACIDRNIDAAFSADQKIDHANAKTVAFQKS